MEKQSLQYTETLVKSQIKRNDGKFLITVVISILLTAMITGSAVYFWQKLVNEKTISTLEQKIASLEEQVSMMKNENTAPKSTDNKTSDWTVYRNKNYGFQIAYPPYYKPTQIGYASPSENVLLLLNDFSTKQDNGFIPVLSVTVHKQTSNSTFDESIIGKFSHMQKVDGVDAKIYKKDGYVFGYTALITLSKSDILEIRVDQMQNIQKALERLDQILSTFKFTN